MIASDNPFWQFSLSIYAEPGAQSECLSLQTRTEIDVNVPLFCAWLGCKKVIMTDGYLTMIEKAASPWQNIVVKPLRAIHVDFKALSFPAFSDAANSYATMYLYSKYEQSKWSKEYYSN